MKQTLLGALAGGVVLFVWGFLAWAVLPLHNSSFRSLPNEDAIIPVLRSSIATDGLYYFPGMPEETAGTTDDQKKANMEAWANKHKQGPVGMVVYHPGGVDPMMASQFIWGFVIFFLASFIASWLLARSTAAASPYLARVAFCGILGVFISFATHITSMVWLYMPMDHTSAMVADAIIGWLLAGFAIGAIVKAPPMEQS